MKVCVRCEEQFSGVGWTCPRCEWSPPYHNGFPDLYGGIESPDYPFEAHEKLSQVENSCFWFVNRNNLIQAEFAKYFPNARTFLEVGCGTGFVLSGLAKENPGVHFMGTDLSSKALKIAHSRTPQAEFTTLDARRLPYVDEVDVVGMFDIVEHIDDDLGLFREAKKALRASGGLMISVPQHRQLWSKYDEFACHKRRYSAQELSSKLVLAGFDVIRLTSFMTFLLPLLVLSRVKFALKRKKGSEERDTLRNLQLSKCVNLAMGFVCEIETKAIKAGFSFPIGGSLLCVARKI